MRVGSQCAVAMGEVAESCGGAAAAPRDAPLAAWMVTAAAWGGEVHGARGGVYGEVGGSGKEEKLELDRTINNYCTNLKTIIA